MTRLEAAKLVAVLVAAYPASAANVTDKTSEVYETYLLDLDYTEADRAIRSLIAESKWMPTVSEIRERVAEEAVGGKAPELAWEDVRKEIRRVGIYGTPTFEDPCTTMAVASLGWRAICDSKSGDWTLRAQFIRAYQAALDKAKRVQNTERLLESVDRRRLEGLHGEEAEAGGAKRLGAVIEALPSGEDA